MEIHIDNKAYSIPKAPIIHLELMLLISITHDFLANKPSEERIEEIK